MVGPRSDAAFLRRKGMTWVHMEGRTGRYQEAVDHGYHVSLELARAQGDIREHMAVQDAYEETKNTCGHCVC